MDSKDVAAAVGKPQVARLKQIGGGIRVGQLFGTRILVKTVTPRTDLDRVEEQGLLHIPKAVKLENTPLPTTGIVLLLGLDFYTTFGDLIKEGDMVMFPKFAGTDFQIEEEDLRIVEAREIMCTLVDTLGALTEVAK